MVKVKRAPKKPKSNKYVLHLYVAGLSPRSQKAIKNIRKICDEHLPGQYQLTIKDIYQKINKIFLYLVYYFNVFFCIGNSSDYSI